MGGNSEHEARPPKGGAPSAMLLDGYDSIAGELRSAALTPSGTDEGGSADSSHIAVCEGMSELTQALNIDQSLAIEFGDIGKADEKLEFVRKQKATTESISIVVHARHREKQLTAKKPRLEAPLDPAKLVEFVRAHGDSYVDSISMGGEYHAVYTFQTQTSEEQKSLKGELEAKVTKGGNSVDGKVVADLHEFARNSRIAWTFDQRLTGVGEEMPKREDMADFVRRFPKMNFNRPVVIDRSTAHYENLPDFPGAAFKPVADNRDYFLAKEGGLARALVQLAARRNKAEWVRKIHECYGFRDTALAAFEQEVAADRAAIGRQLVDYRDNPLQALKRPALTSLTKGPPRLRYEKGITDQWGTSTGSWVCDYPPVEQALQARLRLEWLQLRGSDHADKTTMFYRDGHGDGEERHIGGDGGGGIPQNKLALDSDEFVKTVAVRRGEIIDRLEIVTTRGVRTWAGGDGGKPDGFEATDGRVILGFQGTGGVDINTLQVVWAKLLPCSYAT